VLVLEQFVQIIEIFNIEPSEHYNFRNVDLLQSHF